MSVRSGLAAIEHVARVRRVDIDAATLRHELALGSAPLGALDLVNVAEQAGLAATLLTKQTRASLFHLSPPFILRLKNGKFVTSRPTGRGKLGVSDPLSPGLVGVTPERLADSWTGEVILIQRRLPPVTTDGENGLGWFTSTILKFRHPLVHVMIASLFIQLFALVTPLFFQIIIDKVLVHKAISTLNVVVVALMVIGLFDVGLQYLRTYALAHTSSRIDVELGSRLMKKMLTLPLSYFETRPAGQTIARFRELENIRTFLTSQALTSLIDVLFTLVFLAVLFLYSAPLALVVVAFIPVYIAVVALVRPLLRTQIRERFVRNAESQQFLVEAIVGFPTLKASAVEPDVLKQWEDKLASYVKSAFQSSMVGNFGQNVIQYVTKVNTALVLYFGAIYVIDGTMTVGGLVAFNMISAQVLAPILRLANVWQDFQQAQISVERLGDILNAPSETSQGQVMKLPPIKGQIDISNVSFRHSADGPLALDDVTISIEAGEVVGIVGPSGSGKSTLAKVLQRLYVPETGTVSVDGIDINGAHPAWLRRQVGVVLQENLLFNRTVHENIALASSGLPRARVIRMAQLAGADEFIRRMQHGYDTRIEERGANLSGGQRQRIAIARALARDPKILIMDEATSALDYESERIVQENMKEIVKGRTVIIIAHRLAAVRHCDRVIGMVDGRVVEDASPDQLLARENSLFGRLWAMQGSAA
ncbi:peptidase C39 [Sphingomonas sp. Leaf198]|nr:peptidase C39 [Sphingomonas sp. Leaf198]